jgi:sporulation protein YlmC with PRC-barrel domain
MKNVLLASTAALLTLASAAVAQTTGTTPKTEMDAPAPAATPTQVTPTNPMPGKTGTINWYTRTTNDMRASQLIGSNVKNASGENIGDVNDVILAKDGKVHAVIIGVGGFLGLGERNVAVSFESLRMAVDANNRNVITVDATKDTLKGAPAWTWQS